MLIYFRHLNFTASGIIFDTARQSSVKNGYKVLITILLVTMSGRDI